LQQQAAEALSLFISSLLFILSQNPKIEKLFLPFLLSMDSRE
jgi:hypothetical protein